jgi:hypothetical protein
MAGRRKRRGRGGEGGTGGEAPSVEPEENNDDGAALIPMRLDEDQLKDRGAELVDWTIKLQQLEDKKKEQVKKINADIKLARESTRRLAREIDDGVAFVDPQAKLAYDRESQRKNEALAAADLSVNGNA